MSKRGAMRRTHGKHGKRARAVALTLYFFAAMSGAMLVFAACSDNESSSDYYYPGGEESYDDPYYGGGDASSDGSEWPEEPPPDQSGENYANYRENEFVDPAVDPLATFSLDVDTGSYTVMRRDLSYNRLPVPQGVRLEEYVNYFALPYPTPEAGTADPFTLNVEGAPSRFGDGLSLLRIGVKGREVSREQRKRANLVFLIDVSGSMQAPNKLDLVKSSMKTLLEGLKPDDSVGIVVYSGTEAVLLEPTPAASRAEIEAVIDGLEASGSTAGARGLRMAYNLASDAFIEGGINRVMLCTDGDFNVGLTGDALLEKVAEQRDRGITISTFGFGMGNYNDYLLEQIANRGNGNYAYVDSAAEADRLFGPGLSGLLEVIAKDMKVQVEFNPAVVARYRLMGYDNRILHDDDFDDDTVDAAEIGAGHNATALLEFEFRGDVGVIADEAVIAEVHLRYKDPDGTESREVLQTLHFSDLVPDFGSASVATRFSAAVAEFAEILRKSKHSSGARFTDVLAILDGTADAEIPGATELRALVSKASRLWEAAE